MNRRFPYLLDLALLVTRIAVGVVFLAHGWSKVSGGGTAAGFEKMGVPLPAVSAFYATWVEVLGGIALIVGLAVPIAGVLLFLDMLGAFVLVHAGNGIFVSDGGFELVLVLGVSALLLAAAGSGKFGVDELWRSRRADRQSVSA
ncbi:DoxX family protein [Bailinhaonella thermotolerans]|uniref:DoxX family protein n=1 Tax=Bailinhaonella thermotolerans TaxID=1070861 RepID=A0A3A4B2W5_9ACTN|nr:DoxX family protein [Bailinhaonella thermotolerans]RJL32515.1 DoxX family protein [Bailinhaonella thermotolerans]